MPHIIKSDGRREPFNEDKLRSGIVRALEKRPVGIEEIDAAINRIMKKVRAKGERDFVSQAIGGLVMARLRHIPKKGEFILESGYRLTVEEATERSIVRLRVEPV